MEKKMDLGDGKAKFVHSVYFWLKKDLSQDQLKTFHEKLLALTKIETVRESYVGIPAETDRPIIDRTYDVVLILAFENKEQHDIYQDHPVHDNFRISCEQCWTKVKIYDCE
jgi:hypothetical protein